MIPLSSAVSGGLSWSKLPCSQNYELRRNGHVVGTLARPSCVSSKFDAEMADGRWSFRRKGFCSAEIVDSVSEQPIATFKSAWGGQGLLTFADGETFHVECKGWWRPVWSVVAENGQPLLHLHTREKTVEVPTTATVPENRLSLLIMFAWYRVLQAEEDAASAATVAVMTA
jgi:hypothetical protein